MHRDGFRLGISAASLCHSREAAKLRGPGLKDHLPEDIVHFLAAWHDYWADELAKQVRAEDPKEEEG